MVRRWISSKSFESAKGAESRVRVDGSARGRARPDAQGRCDGAGSEEIGEPSGAPRGFSFFYSTRSQGR